MVDPAHRPAWLLNITNDAWYGFTSGPFQHLAIARMRAVEQGLALARDGNNGVSAMIDPLGRVVARLGLDDVGVLDVPLPQALPPTLYARFGDRPYLVLLLLGLAAAALITPNDEKIAPYKGETRLIRIIPDRSPVDHIHSYEYLGAQESRDFT